MQHMQQHPSYTVIPRVRFSDDVEVVREGGLADSRESARVPQRRSRKLWSFVAMNATTCKSGEALLSLPSIKDADGRSYMSLALKHAAIYVANYIMVNGTPMWSPAWLLKRVPVAALPS